MFIIKLDWKDIANLPGDLAEHFNTLIGTADKKIIQYKTNL